MDTLREELIEAQKARGDLLKWKLLIVAGVGGTALGFSGKGPGNAHLALAVLPLACVYIDMLCRNLSLRIKVVGLFIEKGAHENKELRAYERAYREIDEKVWKKTRFESLFPCFSTVLVSIATALVGIRAGDAHWSPFIWPATLFYGSSLAGVGLAWWINRGYKDKLNDAKNHADKHWTRKLAATGGTVLQQGVGSDDRSHSAPAGR